MPKMVILGIEISEGRAKTTGRDYAIGRVYVQTPLAPPMGENNVAKGFVGEQLEAPVEVLRKIQHLAYPVTADVDVQRVSRFGKTQDLVTGIHPVEVVKKAA